MAWTMSGTYVATCSCSLICPCPVDGRPTSKEGECRGVAVFHIAQGSLDETDLSEVNFAFTNYFPTNLTAGNWKVGVVIDSAASDDQAGALQRIVSGGEGGPFADLAQFYGEFLGAERAAVTFSGGETPSATVGGMSELGFEPLKGADGTDTTVKNAMFGFAPEYRIGKGSGHSSILGITYDSRYGETADFHFASEMAPGEVRGRV